jgi:hypothetical protein
MRLQFHRTWVILTARFRAALGCVRNPTARPGNRRVGCAKPPDIFDYDPDADPDADSNGTDGSSSDSNIDPLLRNHDDLLPCTQPAPIDICTPRLDTAIDPQRSAMQVHIAATRQDIWAWVEDWGPISHWPSKLHADSLAAREHNTPSIWTAACKAKLMAGRTLISRLQGTVTIPPPSDHQEICDIWRQSFELLMVVQSGVACLEICLEEHCSRTASIIL